MTALRNLLAEARARNMLRPLAFDAMAMALAFAALAMVWVETPGASAHPDNASAAEDNALATGGGE